MAILCLSFIATGISSEPSVSGEQITMSGPESQHESVEKKEDRSFFGDMWKKVKGMIFGHKENHSKDLQKQEESKEQSGKKPDKDDAMFSLEPIKNEDEKNTALDKKTNETTPVLESKIPSTKEEPETGIPVFGEVEKKSSGKNEPDKKPQKSQAKNKKAGKESMKKENKKDTQTEEESDE